MGLFLSRFFSIFETRARILMLGLDGAGKTSMLYKLKMNEHIHTIPTIGFNLETVSPVKGMSFTVWDVGGMGRIRSLWRDYYQNTEGLIYVVDSSDRERIAESREELFGILQSDEMVRVPVVIVANKQDLPNALKPSEVTDSMQLHKLTGRKWYIQAACATTGEGIFESMQKMAKMVKVYKSYP
uniref:ADP-ribosylation factor-like isoform X1 n=2 Tax=Crassostrea virginica TaxID=6565 RepID=A0A8B8CJY3_CRAVI|nr:ADP-ribosylation factor-like isoform X1 [Crassostrea virginica]